jgi:hypothetical protein
MMRCLGYLRHLRSTISLYRSTSEVGWQSRLALPPPHRRGSANTRRSRGLPQIAAVDPNGPCSWLSRFWAIVSNSATSRRLSDYRVAVQRVRGVDVECWRPFTAIHWGRGGSPAHCDDRSLDPFVDIPTVGTLDDVDTVSEDTDRQTGLRPALARPGRAATDRYASASISAHRRMLRRRWPEVLAPNTLVPWGPWRSGNSCHGAPSAIGAQR